MLPPVERSRADGVFGRALERIYTLLVAIRKVPLLDGVLLKDVELNADSYQPIQHGLGRIPLGYIVVAQDSLAGIHELRSRRSSTELFLTASSSGIFVRTGASESTTTVDLWVF